MAPPSTPERIGILPVVRHQVCRRPSRWRQASLGLLIGCVASVGCGTSGLAPTTEAGSASPDDVRNEVIALLEAEDVAGLDALLPAETWSQVKSQALDGFTPSTESGGCEEISDTSQECFIFDQDAPFVLGLTVTLQGSDWRPTVVTFDSTD